MVDAAGVVKDSDIIFHGPPNNYSPDLSDDSKNQVFLVVWEHYAIGDADIYGKDEKLGTDGNFTLISNQFNYDLIVNGEDDPSDGSQGNPAIAYDQTSDSFMVVWEDDRLGNLDIFGQIVAGWNPFGGSLPPPRCLGIDPGYDDKPISTNGAGESSPAIANDSVNGRYMVAWNQNPFLPFSASVYGKIIDSDGNEYLANFAIGSSILTTLSYSQPSIAYDNTNQRFNVAIVRAFGTQYDILSHLYDAEGSSLASVFVTDSNEKSVPKIVYTSPPYSGADEEWLLAWQETDTTTSSREHGLFALPGIR